MSRNAFSVYLFISLSKSVVFGEPVSFLFPQPPDRLIYLQAIYYAAPNKVDVLSTVRREYQGAIDFNPSDQNIDQPGRIMALYCSISAPFDFFVWSDLTNPSVSYHIARDH